MPGMDEVITSFANPTVKRIRALADRKHRRREGAFAVEGLQPVWRAVSSGWPVALVVVAPELLANRAALGMVAEQERRGTAVVRVSAEVFGRLSDRDGPAGLIAVIRGAVGDLDGFRPEPAGPVVALLRAGNPGNVGTILRSADAAGAAGLILVGASADPLGPAAVKASMGSLFAVPLAHASTADEVLEWADAAGRAVVAVTGHTDHTLWESPLDVDPVLLFGSEGDGLPDDVAARCHQQVSIPMQGTAESLNLAIAASVALYELKRRRDTGARHPPGT